MSLKLNVKKIAEERGLDKSKLSRRADLNPRTIDRVWHDASKNIQKVETDTLEKLAKALGVTVRDLIAEDDTASAKDVRNDAQSSGGANAS